MFTELKEAILKEAKEDMMPLSYPIDESNKEIEIVKKNKKKRKKTEHGKCGIEKHN